MNMASIPSVRNSSLLISGLIRLIPGRFVQYVHVMNQDLYIIIHHCLKFGKILAAEHVCNSNANKFLLIFPMMNPSLVQGTRIYVGALRPS